MSSAAANRATMYDYMPQSIQYQAATGAAAVAPLHKLREQLAKQAQTLGFQQLGISDIDLEKYRPQLLSWLHKRHHGSMRWMANNVEKRLKPQQLVPETLRVICCRMNYFPAVDPVAEADPRRAAIARYALGRDYHKLLRPRLARLAAWLNDRTESQVHRAFTDSAPVLERALATESGLGWIGKNTMLIDRNAGSWFFLGEIFTDLPLPVDSSSSDHCGSCEACLNACPTGAFIGPRQLDARRCIAYLTIENRGRIPIALRTAIGNRIFGCDECQRVCPWNRQAPATTEPDFRPRHGLDSADLCELFAWSEADFLHKTEGSALRRVGYTGWLRNIAVALGNAPSSDSVMAALYRRRNDPSPLVREHVAWAMAQHPKATTLGPTKANTD